MVASKQVQSLNESRSWAEFSAEVVSPVQSEPSHVNGMQRARSAAEGNLRRCVVVFQSLMRTEERSVLFVGRVSIACCPRSLLPEPHVGLLVTKEVLVIMV